MILTIARVDIRVQSAARGTSTVVATSSIGTGAFTPSIVSITLIDICKNGQHVSSQKSPSHFKYATNK